MGQLLRNLNLKDEIEVDSDQTMLGKIEKEGASPKSLDNWQEEDAK